MQQVKERTTDSASAARAKGQALDELLHLLDAEYGPIGKEAEEWASRELERTSKEPLSSTQGR